jgi:DNA-directed RNA polymerase subunit M/transcription elongation factor TFIIS
MKALKCPNCGSPLEYEASATVLECRYCKHHIALNKQQQERKKKKNNNNNSKAGGKERSPVGFAAAVFVGVAMFGVGAFYVLRHTSSASSTNDSQQAASSSDRVLRNFELASTREDAMKLFGEHAAGSANVGANQVTHDFTAGTVRRVEVNWDAQDKRHASMVNVFFHQQAGSFDAKAVLAKLRSIVPNRIEPQGPTGHRISMGDSVLDLQGGANTLMVWHWMSVHPANVDHATCGTRRAAFWAAARFAAFDGRVLSSQEIELLNGPRLGTITARFDSLARISVEQVTDEFTKAFSSAGRCWSQAGVLCQIDVDHPLVSNVRWRWPNAVKGLVREARLSFWTRPSSSDPMKMQRAVAGCMQTALGSPGEESVVDYVKGTRTWTWTFNSGDSGKAAVGDKATLTERELVFSEAPSTKPDAPAEWPAQFAKSIAALDRCAL